MESGVLANWSYASKSPIEKVAILFNEIEREKNGIYEGDLENNMPHGRGKLRMSQTEYYDGEWKHGAYHGIGTLVKESYEYTGEFVDGKFNGNGSIFIKGKGTYKG